MVSSEEIAEAELCASFLEAVWELLEVKAVEFSSGSAREKRKA